MRFKCGGCDTCYTLDDLKIPTGGARLQCKKCNNKFTIDKNHILTAADDAVASRRFCINCGYAASIDTKECPQCNLRFKLRRAAWIIDENHYYDLNYQLAKQTFLKRFRKVFIAIAGVIIVGVVFWAYFRQPVIEPQQFTGKFLISLHGSEDVEAVSFDFEGDRMLIINTKGELITVEKTDFMRLSNL